jgi:hypothetical protein
MIPCSLVDVYSIFPQKYTTCICGIYDLKLEAEVSFEMFVISTKLHDVTSRKTVASTKTSNAVCIFTGVTEHVRSSHPYHTFLFIYFDVN